MSLRHALAAASSLAALSGCGPTVVAVQIPAAPPEPAARVAPAELDPPRDWWFGSIGRETGIPFRFTRGAIVTVAIEGEVKRRPAKLVRGQAGRWEWEIVTPDLKVTCVLAQRDGARASFRCTDGVRGEEGFELQRVTDAEKIAIFDKIASRRPDAGICAKAAACLREAAPLLGADGVVDAQAILGPAPPETSCAMQMIELGLVLKRQQKPLPDACR